jgi:hypothetical protein
MFRAYNNIEDANRANLNAFLAASNKVPNKIENLIAF